MKSITKIKKYKKNFILVLLLSISCLCLFACGQVEEQPITGPSDGYQGTEGNNPGSNNNPGGGTTDDPGNNNPGGDTTDDPKPNEPKEVEFSVSIVYNKEVYIPQDGEVINAIWVDDYSQYTAPIDNTGYAKKILDGDFNVYIDNIPEGYTYNPNIYTASTDEPIVVIELMKIIKPTKGKGTALYKEYEVSTLGAYRVELTKKSHKVYYEFAPKTNGYYYIESIVNIYQDEINPKIDTYLGTTAYKRLDATINDGGISNTKGYTKNFRWVVKISDEEVGGNVNCFTFAVFAESSTLPYPLTVDFVITYQGEHLSDNTISKFMEAKEADFKTPDYDASKYTYVNSNGGKGNYYSGQFNGGKVIIGSMFKYNEETGYYHVYNSETGEYGAILCAKITQPCAYYEDAFNVIEYHGNKALTVSNGTENYKQFIEIQYAAACNSDGVCYVTQELMEFLQKFSISQRLFMDGNGFVEYTGVYATEEDQWLFACGYYQER